MIEINPNTEVRAIATQAPVTIKIFDKLGIDFCCGGKKPLQEACAKSGLNMELVIAQLMAAQKTETPTESQTWDHMPLAILCRHIVQQHHQFTRNELERLGKMFVKVVARHGEHHPELATMQVLFAELSADMHSHMQKEEQILFPYIEELESNHASGRNPEPSPFGKVENPIRMMMLEHDNAGELLRKLRSLSSDFKAPQDACPTYQGLYQGLIEFESDLHIHIHLENNILFPRSTELEEKVLQAT